MKKADKNEYPYNLLSKAFGHDKFKLPLSTDQKNAIALIIDSFNERTQQVITYRYIIGLTFGEIGAVLNISEQAVASIDRKILKKLRHPLNAEKIQHGLYGVANIKNDSLEQIGLSVRAYNALKRSGIQNVSDIESMQQLDNIRTVGKITKTEILERLSERGIILENNTQEKKSKMF